MKVQQVSKSGTPDILMCLNGLFVAIELKTDKGRLSPLQEYNLNKIAESGGIALVMAPKNFVQGIRYLEWMKETHLLTKMGVWK